MKVIMPFSIILSVASLALLFWGPKACSEFETRRTQFDKLPSNKIDSLEYPWSRSPGLISSVLNYQGAYDIDSNEWVAQFELLPIEAKKLSTILEPIPEEKRKFRCNIRHADWEIEKDLCNYESMQSLGFRGYYHDPSFCEAGCVPLGDGTLAVLINNQTWCWVQNEVIFDPGEYWFLGLSG